MNMRLSILVESEDAQPSSNSLKFDVNLTIRGTHNLKTKFSKEIASRHLREIPIEQVKEQALDSAPIVVDFYDAIQEKELEKIIPIYKRIYYYLKSDALTKTSKKYKHYDDVVNLGEKYDQILSDFKAFFDTVSSEDDLIIKKIGIIYNKCKGNSSKIFKNLFDLYAKYINDEKTYKKQLLKEYWVNKDSIDDVVEEMYSISNQISKKDDSTDVQKERNDAILAYISEHYDDIKYLSDKFLYTEYVKRLFETSGQNHDIDLNSIKEFGDDNKMNSTDSIVKSLAAEYFPHNAEISKSGESLKLSIHSIDYESLQKFVNALYEKGRFSIDCDISIKGSKIANISPYKILYSIYNTTGLNHLYSKLNQLYARHGSNRKVVSEMISVPEDKEEHEKILQEVYRKIHAKYDKSDDSLHFNNHIHNVKSFEDNVKDEIALIENIMNSNDDEYEQFISDSSKKISKNENPNISLKDALRELNDGDLTVSTYRLINAELKNPESQYTNFIINRVAKKAYAKIMNGGLLDKYLKTLFTTSLTKNPDETIEAIKFNLPENIAQASNILEFFSAVSDKFSEEAKEKVPSYFSHLLKKFVDDPEYYYDFPKYMENLISVTGYLNIFNKKDKLNGEVLSLINKQRENEQI